jgi:hypothetical protein
MQTLAADRPGRQRAPIVGRRPELEELTGVLADAAEGSGALVLVEGEAGIGKTRLAETLGEQAAAAGHSVLWGAAWDAGGAPAYWPWTQVVRALLAERPADELREDLGAGAPYVAQIAADVGRVVPVAESAPPLDSEAGRFAAFDATASFLRAAATRRPLVVVLDDLHAADVPTLLLLEFLARGMHGARILALGTCRVDPARPEDEAAAALAQAGRAAKRLALGGLTRAAVEELTARYAGGPPAAELVDRLHQLTEGNPLFLDEVLRLLRADGTLTAPGAARFRIPQAVRDTIRRRLAPLAPDVIETLTTAAVIGPEFGFDALVRATGGEREAVLRQLDAAAAVGLIRPLGHRYRFGHALVRETLYDDLPVHARVARHAAVGEAMLAGVGDPPLSELAYHLLQAAPGGGALRASEYAERAAREALESMAYEQAIDLFAAALDVVENHPRRGPLLLARGGAEIAAGRLETGRATLRAAAAEARRGDDPELLAEAALASAPWGLATAIDDEEGLVPLLREALERLPARDGALRARLLARLAAALYWTEAAEQRRELADAAIAMARRIGDPATLAFVLSDAHRATWDPDSPVRALPWVEEIAALADRIGSAALGLAARSWRISLLLERGEVADVERDIETFAALATRLHQPRGQAQSLLHRCAWAVIQGRFDEAERLLGEAAGYAGLLQQDRILVMRVQALVFVMREAQGRLPELGEVVEQFARAQAGMPVWRCGLLHVHLQAGREDDLRREYERFAAAGFATIPRDNLWLPSLALLAEVCAHLGDAAGAAELRRLLAPYAGRNVVTPDVAYIGPVDRYLALLAATAGDLAAAAELLESAGQAARRIGARPTCARLARDAERIHAAPVPPPTAGVHAVRRLSRRGDMWEIGVPGRTVFVRHSRGLGHLAALLAQPGRDVHVMDLVAPAAAGGRAPEGLVARGRGQDDLGPVLDERARREYRERIAALDEAIEEAEAFHDPERASRAVAERELLVAELAAKYNAHGRPRRSGSDAERARISVTKTLGTAIRAIAAEDAALGHHLDTCVSRGMYCRYEPGPAAGAWEVDPG